MTDKELMQQALYALNLAKSSHNMVLSSDPPQSAWRYYDVDMKLQETITALDKRLAQTEQEPVAVVHVYPLRGDESIPKTIIDWKNGNPVSGPLYTTPPQRPWVGLTEEDRTKAWEWAQKSSKYGVTRIETFAHEIEKKLRKKNT